MTTVTDEEAACAQALLELSNSTNLFSDQVDGSARHNLPEVNLSRPKEQALTPKNKYSTSQKPPRKLSRKLSAAAGAEQVEKQYSVSRIVDLDHSYTLPPHVKVFSEKVDPDFYTLLAVVEDNASCEHPSTRESNKIDFDQCSSANQIVPGKVDSSGKPLQSALSSTSASAMEYLPKFSSHGQKSQTFVNEYEKTAGEYFPKRSCKRNLTKALAADSSTECNGGYFPQRSCKRNLTKALATDSSTECNDNESQKCNFKGKLMQCEFCPKNFILSSMLEKHKAECHPFGSPESSSSLRDQLSTPDLLQFSSEMPEDFVVDKAVQICQICSSEIETSKLVQHLMEEHYCKDVTLEGGENTVESRRSCHKKSLSESMQSDTSTVASPDTAKSLDPDGITDIISCDICYAFVRKNMLSRHVAQRHFSMVSGTGYSVDLEIPPVTALSATPTVSLVASGLLNSTSCREFMIQRYLTDAAITLCTSQFQENPYAQEVAAYYTDSDSPTKVTNTNTIDVSPPTCPKMAATRRPSRQSSEDSHKEQFFGRGNSVAEEAASMKETLAQHGYINLKDTQPIFLDDDPDDEGDT